MPDLTFGEQVKIVLGRKGMTIKELAKKIEQRTGKKMSRQNLTQRLGRDNFQEQDMRMIASILECPLKLSILGVDTPDEKEIADIAAESEKEAAMETKSEEEVAIEEKSDEGADGEYGHVGVSPDREDAPAEETKEEHAVSAAMTDTEESALQAKEDIIEEDTIEEDIAEEAFEEDETAQEALAMETFEEDAAGGEDSGRDITVGEFLEIRKSSGESAQEQLMQELLAEMDSIEREGRERNAAWELRRQEKEQQEAEKKTEKKGGFMSRFRFRKREETPEPEDYSDDGREMAKADDGDQDSAIDGIAEEAEIAGVADSLREENGQESKAPGQANTFSDRIREYTLQDNELPEQLYEDEEEDLEAGDVNPYTGHEYLSNSVRMHPKRIGYVQVYNRKDHRWTDMTEWAFLGYQERKKVLLGKDYEPPIYLD